MSKRGDHFSILRRRSDGSGAEEILTSADQQITLNSWSRDGKYLIYTQRTPDGHGQIWALPLEERSQTVDDPGAWFGWATLPRWPLAGLPDLSESGAIEVYVVAFGGGQGKWQVSATGGMLPLWRADGKELYYLDGNQSLLAVPVKDAGGALEFGPPQTLVNRWTVVAAPFFDVSADGKKILLDRVSASARLTPGQVSVTDCQARVDSKNHPLR